MPPFLPRKRLRSASPEAGPSKPTSKRPSKSSKASSATAPRKTSLFDDLDAGVGKKRTSKDHKEILKDFAATDDESSLSSLSEDEFEDIPGAKRQKVDVDEETDEEDEDIEFEDVETYTIPRMEGPVPSGDLELTLTKDTRISLTNPLGTKKGPSKIERQIRLSTHRMHVQLLMFHNAIRNAWLCNVELQNILLGHLSPYAKESIEKWRRDSHLDRKYNEGSKEKSKGKSKGNSKGKQSKGKQPERRNQRDWGEPAGVLDDEEVNMSRGDPLFRLMDVLVRFWKKRFRITAPGLRKLGYMSLQRLDEETKSFEKDAHDPERHGELIQDIEDFKQCAAKMEGSRDVGAQLFTALVRGIGIESRLVANLQPAGFGWSQFEEASEDNPRCLKKTKSPPKVDPMAGSDGSSSDKEEPEPTEKRKGKQPASSKSKNPPKKAPKPDRQSLRGNKEAPIAVSDSENAKESDDESVVDVTPAKRKTQPALAYDKDLVVPSYWTEILSPVTNIYTAVDAIVLPLHAIKDEEFAQFLSPPKSDKAKQVTSYIVGHSSDGTAKDVTTRYLKGKMWPGRTKGYRLPPEKIPIYGRNGKVKRYEIYSWFQELMLSYARGTKECPRTEIDDHEEVTDLKPAKREKKVVEEGKESLQSYKASTEFVLERHLKREEAILPGAKHAKMFTVKGKGADGSTEEKVFRRKDVVNCKSMETWHKEGRAPREGEEPLKRVPYRAATTNRRRELAEAEIATGGKVLQGLFSREQTDWIIPPPIEGGIIPKNSFGNIDLYVDSMLPKGAVHIPWRGTVKICKRLGIDYAEAVTGFEFGHRMAVPVIEGVVVAEEHYPTMMAEWEKDEAERNRKEDEKRQKAAINMWRKMLMGLRIIERVKEDYGADGGYEVDALNPFNNKKASKKEDTSSEKRQRDIKQNYEDAAGGFFPEGHEEEEAQTGQRSGFFPVPQPEEQNEEDGGGFFPVADTEGNGDDGGFILEDLNTENTKSAAQQAYATPQSFEFSSKAGPSKVPSESSDEDLEMQHAEPKAVAIQQKGRGRPPGAKNKNTKLKAPVLKKETPAKGSTGPSFSSKRKLEVKDSDDEEASSKSAQPSDVYEDEEEEPPKKVAKRGRPTARQTIEPKRKVRVVQDSDDEPSELEENEEEKQPLRKKTPAKRTTKARPASVSKAAPTKTPRRTTRKSATALRSHYFQHSDEDNDEDD